MKVYSGKAVFHGIAVGQVRMIKKEERRVFKNHIEDTEQEIARVLKAVEETEKQLKALYDKAVPEVGKSGAAIFEGHRMMMRDQDYQMFIQNTIRTRRVNAEYAVAVTADHFAGMFAGMQDAYMKERASDVRDVSKRLLSVLAEKDQEEVHADVPTIIVAEDLSPSETVQIDKRNVRSFVTRYGSSNSHTAILAGTMNVPALIGIDYDDDIDGRPAIVDGFQGELIVDPEPAVLAEYEKRAAEEEEKRRLLQELKGKKTVISAASLIYRPLYRMMQRVSDCFEVSFCIWRRMTIRLKKSSFKCTAQWRKPWKVRL